MADQQLDPHKLAVIIPAYNAEATIERAVRSALDQQLPEGYGLQVIVVDDCSRDQTVMLVEAMCTTSPNLTVLRQVENAGPSAARNHALASTNAAWFTPLDSDDYLRPGRLEALLKHAIAGDWDMVADNLELVYEDRPAHPLWPGKPEGIWVMDLERFVARNLKQAGERAELGYIKPLINRRALDGAEAYRAEMRFGEDYDLYTRLLVGGAKSCLIDAAGYVAVQTPGSLSRVQSVNDHGRMVKCDLELLSLDGLQPGARRAIRRHLSESRAEWVWLRAIEAVKARSLPAFLACFFVTPSASLSLIGRLVGQVFIRSGRKLNGQGDA